MSRLSQTTPSANTISATPRSGFILPPDSPGRTPVNSPSILISRLGSPLTWRIRSMPSRVAVTSVGTQACEAQYIGVVAEQPAPPVSVSSM